MRHIYPLLIALSIFSFDAGAQKYSKLLKKASGLEIVYGSSSMGHYSPVKTLVTVSGNRQRISRIAPDDVAGNGPKFPQETTYTDFTSCDIFQTALLPDSSLVTSIKHFTYGENLQPAGDTTHLGLPCHILKTSINSNWIEIWYTDALGNFKATPQPGMGIPEGVVLRVSRNGSYITEAESISFPVEPVELFPSGWGTEMDPNLYRFTLNNCNVITVPVFDHASVRFSGEKAPETWEEGITYNTGGGTIVLRKVSLPEISGGYDIFAELRQFSKGDAYDRTGSVFVIPTDKELSFLDALKDLASVPGFDAADGRHYPALVSTPEYAAPVELMRFFTGFGVRQFNHNVLPGQKWVDEVLYKTDITSLGSFLHGDVWIGAYIGNWDANGHDISLQLKYYPEGTERYMKALPLFNTVNLMEQAGQQYPVFLGNDVLRARFILDEDVKDAQLLYITTGHGGWGGGDEFNKKVNTISLDGEKVISFIPWCEDCATYRNNSPCSGNFSNGESSSDLSRSNWCPGKVTTPEYIPLGDLKAGEHEITVHIPQGAPEGGSISYWCLSGTLIYR
ncbi:MAG: glpgli family protein [Bacteroidales bacterium]|nr:glpgli family protein [Bacteroidales bacterium]